MNLKIFVLYIFVMIWMSYWSEKSLDIWRKLRPLDAEVVLTYLNGLYDICVFMSWTNSAEIIDLFNF